LRPIRTWAAAVVTAMLLFAMPTWASLDCPEVPQASCVPATRASARFGFLPTSNFASQGRMNWLWRGIDFASIGDPVTGTTWTTLCVYDDDGLAWSVEMGPQTFPGHTTNCNGYEVIGVPDRPAKPCWFAKPNGGWAYKNRRSPPHGLTFLQAFKRRDEHVFKLRAKGVYMTNPILDHSIPYRLPISPVVVELFQEEMGQPETRRCWRSGH